MQDDGNFVVVVVAPGNNAVWDTKTAQPVYPFTFAAGITAAQIATLLERYRYAFGRLMLCGSLSSAERQAVQQVFARPIAHGINTNPQQNADAIIGGNQINVNFTVLFPQGLTEIAQTLIHEMMHCAGFTHPNKTSADVPGDNGAYFGTPPLRAKLCIAGTQSDELRLVQDKERRESCVVGANGRCVLHLAEPSAAPPS